jgi:uncharacterized SAM-binding protein YcdF (DUF218 family)
LLTSVALANLWWRRNAPKRRGLVCLTVLLVLLGLMSTPVITYLVTATLEWPYPPLAARPEGIEAIVVLGGAVHAPSVPGQPAELGADSLYRCLYARQLYRAGPACPIIVSGGKVSSSQKTPPVSHAMRDFLAAAGVDPQDIIVEDLSRNTYENAVNVSKLLREKNLSRVLLVTDAIHLRRSQLCFAGRGVRLIPAGVGHGTERFNWTMFKVVPNPKAAVQVERVYHEWAGIVWYWLKGRL